MIAAGIAGFAWTVPAGSIPLILACAVLQGGGFGIAWPFVTRIDRCRGTRGRAHHRLVGGADHAAHRLCGRCGADCGIVANASGFSQGLSGETAADVAKWLFLAFVPLGVVGVLAAISNSAKTRRSRACVDEEAPSRAAAATQCAKATALRIPC